MKKMKLSVVIPVYNEKKYFEKLLRKVMSLKLPVEKEIIIIESNSTDGTRDIVKKYIGRKGIKIIFEKRPGGKGLAVRKGLKSATGDIILIQDADLEYDPDDYGKLIAPIMNKEAKFVIGSRKMGRNTWRIRTMKHSKLKAKIINLMGNTADAVFNFIYNVRITDPQSMYKVFHKNCLRGIKFEATHFNLDWEICARFIRKGYIPLEVPIKYKSRDFTEGKKIRIIREMFLNTYIILKCRFF